MIRRHRRWGLLLASLTAASILLAACRTNPEAGPGASSNPQTAAGQPKRGGTLRIAISQDPPTLDIHTTTAADAYEIGWHIAETLYTFDDQYDVIPLLVEKHEASPDGLTWTFTLRKGVPFHNGKEMTAADVVASLERWGRLAGNGKELFANVASLTAKESHSVEMKLKSPVASLLIHLASPGQGPFIYPKEEMELAKDASGKDIPLKQIVGTGPYRLVEWVKDRHIKLERFEKYAYRNEQGPVGFGGRKMAYADQLLFIPVPDAQTRLASLVAGDYDLTTSLNPVQYAEAQKAGLATQVLKPSAWWSFVFNKKEGPFTSKPLRQAFLASLDMGVIMEGAVGDKNFYRLDPGIAHQELKSWYTAAGGEAYNKRDPQKAKQLMAEAGYKGEKVRLLFNQPDDFNRKMVLVATEQLKDVGWNIELLGMDWATVVKMRTEPNAYEAFAAGFTQRYDPTTMAFVPASWPGWWESKAKDDLVKKIGAEMDMSKRQKLFADLQKVFWDEVPLVKVGDVFGLRAGQKSVLNQPGQYEFHYWNVGRP